MSNERRTRHRRPAATPLAALCAALFVVFALVAPVFATEGPTGLFNPAVSPRSGTPSTTISFSVTYRNHEGSSPDHVSVLVDGKAHLMTANGSTNWKHGVPYHWATKLAAGTHTVSFVAVDRARFVTTIAGGTVKIAVSDTTTPKPTADPTPTPEPAVAPTDAPAATPTPGDSGTGGDTGSGGTDGSGTADSPDGTLGDGAGAGVPDPTGPGGLDGPDWPDGVGTGFGIDSGQGTGAGTVGQEWSNGSGDGSGRSADSIGPNGSGLAGLGPIDDTSGGPGPDGAGGGAGDSSTGGHGVASGGPGWGALAAALQALGIERPPAITMLPMLVGTSSAMTMAFAFAIFGKKRRDEQQPAPDEVLQANAARGHGAVPGGDVVNGVVLAPAVPAPLDLEAGMPRWRRPSLLEARKADPTRSMASSHHMSFENGVVGAVEGRERRVVRYSVVRLLDAPDELRSAEIGQLDQGDEVQLIERSGSYWLVLCPDGRQGWLHKMTLGEVVTDRTPTYSRDIDDDVLSAFLTARARA